MAEILKDSGNLESTTVGVFRTAATVKGGRRFSFSSLVVIGDRKGRVGYGYGKSREVPAAIARSAGDEACRTSDRGRVKGDSLSAIN